MTSKRFIDSSSRDEPARDHPSPTARSGRSKRTGLEGDYVMIAGKEYREYPTATTDEKSARRGARPVR